MENTQHFTKPAINSPFISLMIAFVFSYFYIDIGFALKPYMLISAVIFILSLRTFVIHKLMNFELAMLSFFVYYCSTGFFAKYPAYSMRLVLGIFLVLFCYFVMRYILSIASIDNIERWIIKGGIIFNSLSLILYFIGLASLNFVIAGNKLKAYGVWMDRGFPRLNGLVSDPNVFCFYNFIFFFFTLTHLDKKWAKIGLILSGTAMLLSFSRGGIAAVAFSLMFMFLLVNLKKKLLLIAVLPIAATLLNVTLTKFLQIDIFRMITDRFLSSAEDNGSGRTQLWAQGLEFYKESPLFGIGLFNYRAYSEALYGKAAYMHNTYMDTLVDGGLVGLFLFLLIFIAITITYFKNIKLINDKGFLLFTFIAMSVFMSTYSLMTNEVFYFFLVIFWRYLHEINVKGTNLQRTDNLKNNERKKRFKRYRFVLK